MLKKFLGILLTVIFLTAGVLIFYDLRQEKHVATLLNNIEIKIVKTDNGDRTDVSIKVNGEIPSTSTRLTIFADNRAMEFLPDKLEKERGVTYEGLTAGGTEVNFLINPTFDGNMTIHYTNKKQDDQTPLIYASVNSYIDRYILSDTSIRSKNFEWKQ